MAPPAKGSLAHHDSYKEYIAGAGGSGKRWPHDDYFEYNLDKAEPEVHLPQGEVFCRLPPPGKDEGFCDQNEPQIPSNLKRHIEQFHDIPVSSAVRGGTTAVDLLAIKEYYDRRVVVLKARQTDRPGLNPIQMPPVPRKREPRTGKSAGQTKSDAIVLADNDDDEDERIVPKCGKRIRNPASQIKLEPDENTGTKRARSERPNKIYAKRNCNRGSLRDEYVLTNVKDSAQDRFIPNVLCFYSHNLNNDHQGLTRPGPFLPPAGPMSATAPAVKNGNATELAGPATVTADPDDPAAQHYYGYTPALAQLLHDPRCALPIYRNSGKTWKKGEINWKKAGENTKVNLLGGHSCLRCQSLQVTGKF
ncbi:uncharacterized protein FFNC_15410 [Fusarium fujikuroi]|nr:uncharacterized protein FFNC_15410 [Fusarium fujikuroi]